MLNMAASRILILSVTFLCLKEFGFIIVIFLFIVPMFGILLFYKIDKKLSHVEALKSTFNPYEILSAITSIFCPCLVIEDCSRFYIFVGLSR